MNAQLTESPAASAVASTFGVPTFTKLDANGAELPPTADTWSAVRVTLGDQSIEILNGNVGGRRMTHAEALEACKNIDALGSQDWRLWTDVEALAIVDRSKWNPAVDADFFPDIEASSYWTASPDASDPDYAWFVGFGYGDALLDGRSYHAFARAVRVASARQ